MRKGKYLYVVFDEDGDVDTYFETKEEAVAACNAYVGWVVQRFKWVPNSKRKDGAIHVSTKR